MSRVAIICVDDEPIILSSLEQQLKCNIGRNYDIELASSGKEALSLCAELEAEGIDVALVISDQTMSGMSGDEFLIELHAAYPKTLKILLTGQAAADSVGNIVNAAALYRYIAKPWEETDLILTVKEALRRYGQEEQLAQQNITLRKTNRLLQQSNQKVSKSLKLLLAVFETAGDGILVLDNKGDAIVFNQKFASLWQIDTASILGDSKHILGLISRRLKEPNALDSIVEKFKLDRPENELLKLNNGTILESYFQTQKLEGKIVGKVWGFRDVTAREKANAAIKHQARHDTLTKLPKRRILTYQLSDAIIKAKANSHLLAVMFVDLNQFKKINDSLGHKTGDALLKQVVQRLKQGVRGEDVIARWGNDEFTMLLPKIQHQNEATAVANRILSAFKSPFTIKKKTIYVTVGIGIAAYPEHGKDAETLLKNADVALSHAQQNSSNNYQYYDSTFSSQANELLTLENLLHSALEKKELILYYQPIVNVVTGKIAKMEALLRWKNSQVGSVPPYIFIPLAEKNGSIVPIGEWVLKTACAQNKTWQDMGLEPIKMSVNLSVRQFQQRNLVSNITKILEQTKLQPNYLELEITESITIQDADSARDVLDRLNRLGISLSMDDFGTGYSSLSYLQKFPFQTLKIDRSFIKDLRPNSPDMAIIDAVITLGQGLNLDIVAEGVETEELRDLLQNLGCEYIQGYLYSKPLPAVEATKLLTQHCFA